MCGLPGPQLDLDRGGIACPPLVDENMSHCHHVRCVVAGGARSADGSRFNFGQESLSVSGPGTLKVLRGKYLDASQAAYEHGELQFAGELTPLAELTGFAHLCPAVAGGPWRPARACRPWWGGVLRRGRERFAWEAT